MNMTSFEESRGRKILKAVLDKDRERLQILNIPKYESTKCLTPLERESAVTGWVHESPVAVRKMNHKKQSTVKSLDISVILPDYNRLQENFSKFSSISVLSPSDLRDNELREVFNEIISNNDRENSFDKNFYMIPSATERRDKTTSIVEEPVTNIKYGSTLNGFSLVPYSDSESSNESPISNDIFSSEMEREEQKFPSLHQNQPGSSFCENNAFIDPDSVESSFCVSDPKKSNQPDSEYEPTDYDSEPTSDNEENTDVDVDKVSPNNSTNYKNSTPIDVGATVLKSNNRPNRRVYDKRDSCLYCEKMFSKLVSHLEAVHSEEKEVAKFLSLRKKSTERRNMIQSIRNKGNYLYNKNVYESKKGEIIPYRRPAQQNEDSNYLPCEHCLAFFKKKFLSRHVSNCWNNPNLTLRKSNTIGRSLTMLTAPSHTSSELRELLNDMSTNKYSLIVRNDDLIMKYGEWLCEKNIKNKHLKNDNSQKLREMARLIVQLQENDSNISNLRMALKPKNFFAVVQAVKDLTGINQVCGKKRATLALKIGYSLQKCLQILKNDAIIKNNDEERRQVDDYLELYQLNWSNLILKKATEEIERSKWNKPSLLPIAEDVSTMNQFMHKMGDNLSLKLMKNEAHETDFEEFCQITLGHVITFNRKRVGEVERLEKSVFLNGISDETPQGEIESSLSKHEKLLVKNLSLIHIRGKRGRKVPLLLTPKLRKNIDLILTKRETFHVPNTNKFVFGKCRSNSFIRGSDALRNISRKCGAKKPENLTSTRLRKHIATVSQILNLTPNDLDHLSRHLGHDINIHREYYRLPEKTMQLAKVSKLLLQFDKGIITPGLNLDEMNVDLDWNTPSEASSDDSNINPESLSDKNITKKSKINSKTLTKDSSSGFNDLPVKTVQPIRSEDCLNTSDEEKDFSENIQKKKKKKMHCKREKWLDEETEVINSFFKKDIIRCIVPNKLQCDRCIEKHPVLKSRSWVAVKSKVHNLIVKERARKQKMN